MSRIPFKNISNRDFQDAPSWFLKFLDMYNDRQGAIATSFQNGISLENNTSSQFVTLFLRVPAAGSAVNPYPLSFTWNYPTIVPKGVLVVSISATDNSRSVISSPTTPDWSYRDLKIVINGLPGNLAPDKTYSVTFWAFA